jgi:hypothetical protein
VNTGGCEAPYPVARCGLTERHCRNFYSRHGQNREPERALATLRFSCVFVNRPPRDPMTSFISPELLWLATAFIMLMAAFLAAAAE